ncbi:MAG: acyltransferase [Terriglobales bacterium]
MGTAGKSELMTTLRPGAGMLRQTAKLTVQGVSVLLAWPFAALAGFGRFRAGFDTCAHVFALLPGLAGDYMRVAFYAMTLESCALNSRISFGTFFATPHARVGAGVYIGQYGQFGYCIIGDRSQIASHVQILSGGRQHGRDPNGRILGSEPGNFPSVAIGHDCWLGAAAIVMADVGPGTTVGAGAVVTRPVPPGVTAVGNPARPLPPAATRTEPPA